MNAQCSGCAINLTLGVLSPALARAGRVRCGL